MLGSINFLSLFLPITSLQILQSHAITHSFAQRRSVISPFFNSFRTLSIATGVVPPPPSTFLSAGLCLYAANFGRPLFSYSYELLSPPARDGRPPLSFRTHSYCPGLLPPACPVTVTASPIVTAWRAGILLVAGSPMPQVLTHRHAVGASHVLRVGCCAIALCARAVGASADGTPQLRDVAAVRLVSAEEGRKIAAAAVGQDEPVRGAQDCSHLVHQIYSVAGYEYPYASSFDLYAGHGNFRRVRHAQAGDLITWPGHVGIVLYPKQHSFYSLVRSGLQAEDYLGPYWRSRGTPRFYRYVVDPGSDVISAKTTRPVPPSSNNSPRRNSAATTRAEAEKANPQQTAEEASLRSKGIAAPLAPSSLTVAEPIPSKILITPEQRRPTDAEVFDGISELGNAAANGLRSAQPLNVKTPIVIFDELRVERVETKRDKGWAHLQIDSHVRITAEGADFKRRREKVRWELRRDASGWVAIAPEERSYVGRDAAVRVLAAQLAEMAQSEAAAQHDETVIGQEARIANLLSALLEK